MIFLVLKKRGKIMKSKTPNCKICEWLSDAVFDGDKIKECGAQGYKLTTGVYNKKMCRRLFKIISSVSRKK